MTKKLSLLSIATTILISACAVSMGEKFDTSYAGKIERGKTTQVEVKQHMGTPHAVTVDGQTETWSYSHYQGPSVGATYGAVLGGKALKDTSETATIVFKKGVVTDYSFRQGASTDNALTRAYSAQLK